VTIGHVKAYPAARRPAHLRHAHLEHNVPVAIISAWLGHADTAFTMRTYVHNQPEKLALAAESISSWTRRKKSAQ
jgi:integrase